MLLCPSHKGLWYAQSNLRWSLQQGQYFRADVVMPKLNNPWYLEDFLNKVQRKGEKKNNKQQVSES